MAILKFQKKGMQILSACVPKTVVKTTEFAKFFGEEHVAKFSESTGIVERRFASENQCASDLCLAAAQKIFGSGEVCKEEIDLLIFITQTQDFRTPGVGQVLQDKLGLSQKILVYDLNVACSAFLHGLVMGYTFLELPNINKVLLMVGDTISKLVSKKDKSTGMLLGDAGIATVLSRGNNFSDSYFSMNTDGSNIEAVITKGGGYRFMSSAETLKDVEYEDGSIRNMEQSYMNGMDVFSYAISRLPKDIKALAAEAHIDINDVNWYVFHQANKFMMSTIAKKMKIDMDKFLYSIYKFGNTSGCSIPLTLVVNKDKVKPGDTMLMNAIGASFVYGSAYCNIADCKILDLIEI